MLILFIFIVILTSTYSSIPIDTTESCLTCQSTISELQTTWSNESSINAIIESLKNQCKEKYSIKDILKRKICDSVVDVLVQIPPGLIDGMNSLAWPIPQALCGTLKKCQLFCCDDSNIPEQIHLSASSDITVMTVSWTTLNSQTSIVQYGTSSEELINMNKGDVNTYEMSGWRGSLHSATMTGLQGNTRYFYRVGTGDESQWSDVFSFSTFDLSKPVVYAIIGDMAYDVNSDYTVKSLIKLVDDGSIHAVLHSGDISYADGYDKHFDDFMNKIQPVAARVPYMTSCGNHEFWYDFVAYKNRFNMPGHKLTKNMYYEWTNGPVKFISLNSETAIDTADFHALEIDFLKKTLEKTDRNQTPFVVVHFHRPMYCSNDDECLTKATKLRNKAEDILFENSVDLVISGHVHSYERTLPVYNNTINAKGPIYLVQGASGNREGNKGPYPSDLPNWSANQQTTIGYGILTVSTDSMSFSFYDSESNNELDRVSISKK